MNHILYLTEKIPIKYSFQFKRLSPLTVTYDIRDENLIEFLLNKNLINRFETRDKNKQIGIPIYACKIGTFKWHYSRNPDDVVIDAYREFKKNENELCQKPKRYMVIQPIKT
jgi:hypothetical protein